MPPQGGLSQQRKILYGISGFLIEPVPFEHLSKLPVSHLRSPIILPYIILHRTPWKKFRPKTKIIPHINTFQDSRGHLEVTSYPAFRPVDMFARAPRVAQPRAMRRRTKCRKTRHLIEVRGFPQIRGTFKGGIGGI